jgi:Fic family protein
MLTGSVLEKEAFWRRVRQESIVVGDRQKKIVNLLLDGFEGKLTTEKWAKLTKSSHDTALRDIHDLISKGILKQEKAGGRSTAYSLVI